MSTNLIRELNCLNSWEEKYQKIISFGRLLPVLPVESKIEANKIDGCQSRVWLQVTLSSDQKMLISADSDSLIVKGLIAVVIDFYENMTPSQIVVSDTNFINQLNLHQNLTAGRITGLEAIIQKIKTYALGFTYLE